MAARGDRERDLADIERELAHENAQHAVNESAEDTTEYRRRANLHLRAAALLDDLAEVYDDLDSSSEPRPAPRLDRRP